MDTDNDMERSYTSLATEPFGHAGTTCNKTSEISLLFNMLITAKFMLNAMITAKVTRRSIHLSDESRAGVSQTTE